MCEFSTTASLASLVSAVYYAVALPDRTPVRCPLRSKLEFLDSLARAEPWCAPGSATAPADSADSGNHGCRSTKVHCKKLCELYVPFGRQKKKKKKNTGARFFFFFNKGASCSKCQRWRALRIFKSGWQGRRQAFHNVVGVVRRQWQPRFVEARFRECGASVERHSGYRK